jgi:lipoprotein-anchoring transpeptidase ErfK/SrfK
VGQRLKVVRQPLHAVVHKGEYRLDLWAGPPLPPGATSIPDPGPDGQAQGWTFIRSFRVGLGDGNSTPVGLFVVRPNSKLINPEWVNPRTRERFAADDPKNPIGERWIGLQGVDERSRPFLGYGIHGTIEPDSIGRQMSMGCVRLLPGDVEVVYDLLMPGVSTVRIVD